MVKTVLVAGFLAAVLVLDLLTIGWVLTGWHKFNSDPVLTLIMQILLAFILIFNLIQITSRKSVWKN